MKQRLIYLIILLLSISYVSALSAELIDPPDGAYIIGSNSITFKCKPFGLDLIQVRLYTDATGTWDYISDLNPENNTESTFTINNIENGNYKWNCKVIAGEGNVWAPANRTFTISFTNEPPTFSGPIANQTWNKDSSLSNVFDLDTYFSDPESESLDYSVSGSTNINVAIDASNQVSFSQPSGWWGTEKITFEACDPESQCTSSNEITLTVLQTLCTEDWDCTDWSDCEDDEQTRTCTDLNSCGTENDKPDETKSCGDSCTEDWECTVWSACEDGYKTRECTDANDCGTTDDKPSESMSCSGSYMLEIISSTPSSSKVTMNKGTSKVFRIETNLEDVDIKWYLDNTLQSDTNEDFRFTPTSTGTYTIKVIAEKDSDKDAKEWEITVEDSTIEESICGNDKIDEGEDCLTCPEDASCQEGETCDEGICKTRSSITGYITKITDPIKDKWYYFLIILGLIFLTIIGLIINKKMKKDHPLSAFDEKQPFLGKIRRRLREWDRKRVQKKANKTNIKTLQKSKKEEIEIIAPIGTDSITNFIKESRSNGYSDKQIIKALKSKGWSKKHIKLAFQKFRR